MEKITQKEMKDFQELDSKLAGLKAKVKNLETEKEVTELTLIDRYDKNANVEKGRLVFNIKEMEKRTIQWKKHFIEFLGQTKADKVFNSTEPTKYRHINIFQD